MVTHTAISGVHVLCGLRQSMPSSSIDNCARDRHTVPSVACGQMKRPFSNRFANRHRLSPSNHKHLTMSPDTTTCCIPIEQCRNRIPMASAAWTTVEVNSQDWEASQACVLR